MNRANWVVHKFGGTSVANADRYKTVWQILEEENAPRQAVVVSAMSGVTDALLELVELAGKRNSAYTDRLEALKNRHLKTLDELLPASARPALRSVIEHDLKQLIEVLRGVWQTKQASEAQRELVAGHGEIWSAQMLHAYVASTGKKATWLDARDVLIVTPSERAVTVDWTASLKALTPWLENHPEDFIVVTGFVASTPDGIATTLKRNGSDFSASIFGKLLNAERIVIWTDVDGVLTADPRLVPDAVVVQDLSYSEATELAYFGAKVVHPSTMAPAIDGGIPIWIRNTFRPHLPGTKIHAGAKSDQAVKGFTTINNVALVNLEGTGMVGVPGVAERLFGSLRSIGVSVIMISQASSEHSICFAIPEAQAEVAKAAVEKTFYAELHQGEIETIAVTRGCSVLALVGDNMVSRAGVAGNFFTALGKAGINVRAIAQGSSERNISVVVSGDQAQRALRASHSAFYLSPQTISIGVIGCGRVGAVLLDQIHGQADRLRTEIRTDLRVRALMNSRSMVLSDAPLDLAHWRNAVESGGPVDLEAFLTHTQATHIPHAVLIDTTASAETARQYPDWLRRGFHVITPNKMAATNSVAFYQEMKAASRAAGRHYLYETTVGAGLPILNTLRELVRTGDKIHRIEGVLSGTLSFLFNSFDGKRPFSEILREALAAGYTEPDPREDLSGRDVARKLVILAREIGLDLELDAIEVESLVPETLRVEKISREAFVTRLAEMDAPMAARLAAAAGGVLRYVGVIEMQAGAAPTASVSLRKYSATHSFARLGATDNIVAFTTARYQPQPLVVQGPGAGPEVTAAGVFADLLRLAAYLGGNL